MKKKSEGKTIDEWMEIWNKQPNAIRYLKCARALQRIYPNMNVIVGASFYREAQEKYPEHFDENGDLKP